jgi:hypothetical protein
MIKKSKKNGLTSTTKPRGFFRVQITEDGKGVLGDSGWQENQVTNDGVTNYVIKSLIGSAGPSSVAWMGLGTGTAPGAADTTLNGEIYHKSASSVSNSRASVATSVVSSRTARFTAAFNSANQFVTASVNISNVGLFAASLTSLANNGTLFAGNTYTSSSCATNQNVNVTYDITFP